MTWLIVGGGLIGGAVARELAMRGASVLVLERGIPGAEASSAAAGILGPRMEAHGQEPHRSLGIQSLKLYPTWVRQLEAESGSQVGYWPRGLWRLVLRGEEPDALRPDGAAIWREDLPDSLSHAAGGWWLPEEASVEAPLLSRAMRPAAESRGARFRSHTTVTAVHADGVELAGGERLSGTPVVCAGAWSALANLPVRPVRGQLIEVQGPAGLLESVVFCRGGYLVPRPDGRVVVGATSEEVGFAPGVTVAGLAHLTGVLAAGLPTLREARVLQSWSNFRPATPDGAPVVGWTNGVFAATGHYRNGILLAPLTAQVVADALLDGTPVPASWRVERFGGG